MELIILISPNSEASILIVYSLRGLQIFYFSSISLLPDDEQLMCVLCLLTAREGFDVRSVTVSSIFAHCKGRVLIAFSYCEFYVCSLQGKGLMYFQLLWVSCLLTAREGFDVLSVTVSFMFAHCKGRVWCTFSYCEFYVCSLQGKGLMYFQLLWVLCLLTAREVFDVLSVTVSSMFAHCKGRVWRASVTARIIRYAVLACTVYTVYF
jgi:hypothetical protein